MLWLLLHNNYFRIINRPSFENNLPEVNNNGIFNTERGKFYINLFILIIRFLRSIWKKKDDWSTWWLQTWNLVFNYVMIFEMTIKFEIKLIRPRLGRSCRCMKIQGHGYESVVDCVSFRVNMTQSESVWFIPNQVESTETLRLIQSQYESNRVNQAIRVKVSYCSACSYSILTF